jgi:cell division protein FtsQ
MKQFRNILFVVATIAYLIVVSGFINDKESGQRIISLKIRIIDSSDNQFIHVRDIHRMLNEDHFDALQKMPSEVPLEHIENRLKKRQIIDKAEAYITEPGIIHIEISQKTPFVRVFNRYGQGYFLDEKGNIIPLTGGYAPFVIVANGFIAEPFTIGKTINIMDAKHDSIARSLHTIYDVYKLAAFITSDSFWDSQIEQIYVNNKYEFELIPRIGSHVIELGYVDNLDEKFENLKILYLKGFNNLGWNHYDKISLKYKNQVVCTKIQ